MSTKRIASEAHRIFFALERDPHDRQVNDHSCLVNGNHDPNDEINGLELSSGKFVNQRSLEQFGERNFFMDNDGEHGRHREESKVAEHESVCKNDNVHEVEDHCEQLLSPRHQEVPVEYVLGYFRENCVSVVSVVQVQLLQMSFDYRKSQRPVETHLN